MINKKDLPCKLLVACVEIQYFLCCLIPTRILFSKLVMCFENIGILVLKERYLSNEQISELLLWQWLFTESVLKKVAYFIGDLLQVRNCKSER